MIANRSACPRSSFVNILGMVVCGRCAAGSASHASIQPGYARLAIPVRFGRVCSQAFVPSRRRFQACGTGCSRVLQTGIDRAPTRDLSQIRPAVLWPSDPRTDVVAVRLQSPARAKATPRGLLDCLLERMSPRMVGLHHRVALHLIAHSITCRSHPNHRAPTSRQSRHASGRLARSQRRSISPAA